MSVKKYRAQPVEITAIQLTRENWDEVIEFVSTGLFAMNEADCQITVWTTHGEMAIAREGDWVIPDSRPRTFYPCKDNVFQAKYTEVQEEGE